MSLDTEEEIPKENLGAVTKGFMFNKINKNAEQNIQIGSSEKKQPDQLSKGMSPQIHTQSTVPQFGNGYFQGRFDNTNRFNQFENARLFEFPNDYSQNRQDQDINQQMSLPRQSMSNQAVYGYNQPVDYRGFDQMRFMCEMMNSMMMLQQNNFKTMIESHTHLMNKLLDKTTKRKRRHNRKYSSSSDE